jgi:hypothetical protein
MRENAGTHMGIYLVGDFTCDSWRNSVGLRQSQALGGVTTLQTHLDTQAAELSTGDVRVRAVVLDTSL